MTKQIRPLITYKKENPEIFKYISEISETLNSTSSKGKENDFYFVYALLYLGVERFKEILDPAQINIIEHLKKTNLTDEELEKKISQVKTATEHLTKREYESFYFTPEGKEINKGTVSEIGRLLLYGWYYDIMDWAKNIGMYIYRSYKNIEASKDLFNDLEFQKAVKVIRDNISYYYHNEPELKLYILETFFKDRLEELLPEKSKELKEMERTINFVLKIRESQKKEGIDYWINKAEDYESYSYYLQDLMSNYDYKFLSFEDWKRETENENKEENGAEDYFDKYERLKNDYKGTYINNIGKID